jgi:Lon protease-like protein
MFDLPLFPLNTVLFPGMPLPLHIFEERYKDMVMYCLDKRQPFGVVLIQQGNEAHGPLAMPYAIGCTARILEVEPLAEGRMNIITLGENRFRILSLNHEQPYLIGKVELYPLELGEPETLETMSQHLLPLVRRYMQTLTQIGEVSLDPDKLPDEPIVLAYLAAVLLQMPPHRKQELLACAKAVDLMRVLVKHYRLELSLLRAQVAHGKRDDEGFLTIN